jgi:hypothetical protein
MIRMRYSINGTLYRRTLPDTYKYRRFLWTRCAILIREGMTVTISQH